MSNKVYVAGVGMTKFIKPRDTYGYEELGLEASAKALVDAGINYDEVQRAVAGYVYGDSTCGQRVIYQLGLTGIPVYNVNNNCSTGSTALAMGRDLIRSGLADVILCVGFEKMERGSLGAKFTDRADPLGRLADKMFETNEASKASVACQFFGNAAAEYIEKTNGNPDAIPMIAQVNHAHSVNNPYSQFQDVYTLEQIKNSPKVHKISTKLTCCPTSDGAAAAVLISEKYLQSHPDLQSQAIEIAAQSLHTDVHNVFDGSSVSLIGDGMTRLAVNEVYKTANITPDDVQVVELHDCFAANELVVLDALGLSKPGKACELVEKGDITYGGKYVVNPSGGLISKGHPLGATGLAQCAELCWHLRGWTTNRAVPHTRYCLQHNLGLGGAVVVTLYKRADGKEAPVNPAVKNDGRARLGYNPAVEVRHLTREQFEAAASHKASDKFSYGGNKLVPAYTSSKL
ncbi:uncharacterized protein SAPINGB_P000415 [Magnusiomyces paraingens]|uniref:propanoyl-CoA C-acyltransferase n=1 Tax=Magnusiomyces paraingens TaxID=2606893 RepID=A0A5E8B0H0_9ASCO|nr:uncharacterized protein SAPINGB_P000415 [Saprochaete ingens]VVT44435.1 unnamed protein product [Saprochaete ingens]